MLKPIPNQWQGPETRSAAGGPPLEKGILGNQGESQPMAGLSVQSVYPRCKGILARSCSPHVIPSSPKLSLGPQEHSAELSTWNVGVHRPGVGFAFSVVLSHCHTAISIDWSNVLTNINTFKGKARKSGYCYLSFPCDYPYLDLLYLQIHDGLGKQPSPCVYPKQSFQNHAFDCLVVVS